MLSRTVARSNAPAWVAARSMSSSNKSLKGINVGSHSSPAEPPSPSSSQSQPPTSSRFTFASLRNQVEPRSLPSDDASLQERRKRQVEESTTHPLLPPSPSPTPASTRLSQTRSAFGKSPSSNQPGNDPRGLPRQDPPALRTNQSSVRSQRAVSGTEGAHARPVGGRRLSVGTAASYPGRQSKLSGQDQSRREAAGPQESREDGWGSGLRQKIERAQEQEERSKLETSDGSGRRSIYEPPSQWQASSEDFRSHRQVKSEGCSVPGYEQWRLFARQDSRNLLGRRVIVGSSVDAFQCLASLNGIFLAEGHWPNILSLSQKRGDSTVGHFQLQIELGGQAASTDGSPVLPDEQRLQAFAGISAKDAKLARMVEAVLGKYGERRSGIAGLGARGSLSIREAA